MKIDYKLPHEYTPFQKLNLCNNALQGVQIPLTFNNIPVLLIGKGDIPRIWLSAPSNQKDLIWNYAVIDNKSISPAIRVGIDPKSSEVCLEVDKIEILRVQATSAEEANIKKLDLRPIGINIYGSETELTVGNMKILQNTFLNSIVAVATGSTSGN
jgi:hypothetical protein